MSRESQVPTINREEKRSFYRKRVAGTRDS
jgi:hypothetical protein